MEILNCQTLKTVEVGDIVYMRPTGNARFWHSSQPYVKGVVTKIGRKYFSVNRGLDGLHSKFEERFTIDGAECVNDENYGYILYASEEEFTKDTERERKLCEIKTYFGSLGSKQLSYETTSKIHELLSAEGLLV